MEIQGLQNQIEVNRLESRERYEVERARIAEEFDMEPMEHIGEGPGPTEVQSHVNHWATESLRYLGTPAEVTPNPVNSLSKPMENFQPPVINPVRTNPSGRTEEARIRPELAPRVRATAELAGGIQPQSEEVVLPDHRPLPTPCQTED